MAFEPCIPLAIRWRFTALLLWHSEGCSKCVNLLCEVGTVLWAVMTTRGPSKVIYLYGTGLI
jgi:hypothetical protein